jgi:diaminopimelate decarboxylase
MGKITQDFANAVVDAAKQYGTPFYLYDESVILEKCANIKAMPNAYGMEARYAMKANSNKAILQLIASQGINIDASSFNEVKRAINAGVAPEKIMFTSQEVLIGEDRKEFEQLMLKGLKYNVCSKLQLELAADFLAENNLPISMRIHPGVGSGESASRNTGDKYSCFGIHLTDLESVIKYADDRGILINAVHVHIGSGGDPEAWRENIDRELGFVEKYFPNAVNVSFGGGFKVARMPGEVEADIQDLGEYAKKRFEEFFERTGRKLTFEAEPGTYYVANSGYLVTRVMDKKQTGPDGFDFILTDGGMEVNTRPLLYGSNHPFYLISKTAEILSDEFELSNFSEKDEKIIVGRCCESGDSQSLDEKGSIVPRIMADPNINDYLVVGGCGAYCSTMTPFNYNSHVQAPEILLRKDDSLKVIRNKQVLEQVYCNEIGLD